MIPDGDHPKTVKIPVRIVGGVPKPFYGGHWPPLTEGTIGDLVVPEFAFVRPEDARLLNAPLTFQILPCGTRVIAGVKDSVLSTIQTPSIEIESQSRYNGFVEIHLKEDLYLQLRGTKKASLRPCMCFIPSLNVGAGSLNEAYTLISGAHEPWRRSHTGNAFINVFYKSATSRGERVWESLEKIRTRMEARLESRFRPHLPPPRDSVP